VKGRIAYLGALGLDLLGAALALFASTRIWLTIVTPRSAPLGPDVLRVPGRTLDAAPTALALVALAGVVGVIAGRGWLRRVVGVLLALTGLALAWRSAQGLRTLSASAARQLVLAKHSGVGIEAAAVPRVVVHAGWPVLSLICGLLVAAAGVLVAILGPTWSTLSARYEAPAEQVGQASSTTLWAALDSGDDPTDSG
jgi:uncharacterized membrane protein (TIGR02234 family)